MKNERLIKKYFFLSLSILTVFILFYFDIIHKTYVIPYVPETANSVSLFNTETWSKFKFFGDTKAIFMFAECHKAGYDVYLLNECSFKNGYRFEGYQFQYGRALLFLPIIDIAYREIFLIIYGSLLIGSLIYLVFRLIEPQSIVENIICLILIFNPTTLLLFESLNFDLFIFLSLVAMIFLKKNYIIKILINFLLFSIKYYPLLFIINFFVENKLLFKKKIFYIFLFLFLSILLVFFNFNDFALIADNVSNNGKNIKYNFSLNGITRIIEHILPVVSGISEITFIYNGKIIKFSLLFILLFISYLNYFFLNEKIILTEENNSRKKLFYVCANSLIILYVLFNNNYIREVFFIGIVPYLLIMSKKNCLFSTTCFSLIFFKYVFMIVVWPSLIFTNIEFNSSGQFFVGTKILLDFLIMSLLITYMIKVNLFVYKDMFKKQ